MVQIVGVMQTLAVHLQVTLSCQLEVKSLCQSRLNYGTTQAQRRTRSHMQLCSRFKKSPIEGRGSCFACETTWQLFRLRKSRAKQLPLHLISDF